MRIFKILGNIGEITRKRDLPGGPVVKIRRGAVSLVRELRFCLLCSGAKKLKKIIKNK